MSAGSDAAEDASDDLVDAVQEQRLDEGTDRQPVADDFAPPPLAAAPAQVSWTGLAPPPAIEPAALIPPSAIESAAIGPAAIEPEPAGQPQAGVTESPEAESPAAKEPAAVTEKKVVWSSSPSNSTISFGPGYSSRRDDL